MKGPAVAASYLFVVFFNILRIERLVVSERTVGRFRGSSRENKERNKYRGKKRCVKICVTCNDIKTVTYNFIAV